MVIPTYNGAKKIQGLLSSLQMQTIHDFEIVVVVDGSSDNTLEVVESFRDTFKKLKVIDQDNCGRAQARNQGAAAASGNLLLFVDDDIWLAPGNLEGHREFHQSHGECLLFGNPIMDVREPNGNDFNLYRYTNELRWKEGIAGNGIIRIGWNNYCFTSQNLSISRTLFQSLGGFDGTMTDSEDFDLSVRALIKGMTIYYDKMLVVFHQDFIPIEKYTARQKEYHISRALLLRKHPEYFDLLPQHFALTKPDWSYGIKRLLMGSYDFWLGVYRSAWFSKVPKRLRFFLYDLFIYVHSTVTGAVQSVDLTGK